MKAVLLGPPGAGKGTQATKIQEKFDVSHISTGDIFRSNIKNETDLGKKVKEILAKGQLVKDDVTIDLVKDALKNDVDNFLLDGFPRNLVQAEALDEFLKNYDRELDCVLNLDVDKELLIGRISGRRVCPKCGASYNIENNPPKEDGICDICGSEIVQREDDTEEAVRDRIDIYETQTAPLIDYYTNTGKIINIDGSVGVKEVFEQIERALDEFDF